MKKTMLLLGLALGVMTLAPARSRADTISGYQCQDYSGTACNGADLTEETVTVCIWIDDTTPEASQTVTWGAVVLANAVDCGGGGDGSSGDCTADHSCTF